LDAAAVAVEAKVGPARRRPSTPATRSADRGDATVKPAFAAAAIRSGQRNPGWVCGASALAGWLEGKRGGRAMSFMPASLSGSRVDVVSPWTATGIRQWVQARRPW